jgi:DNA-binding MarR family transcriptional regulator
MELHRKSSTKIGETLKQAQHVYRTYADDLLRPLGISTPQYTVLCAIASEKGLSSVEIARIALVTPQTMQSLLTKLQYIGLITKARSLDNPKMVKIDLTDRGESTVTEAKGLIEQAERLLVEAVGEANAQLFEVMLARCVEKFRF